MRWLAAALLLLLAASVPFALRVREGRASRAVEDPFVTGGAAERARFGEEHDALGVAISGYGALVRADPADPEARKALIRLALEAGATIADQPSVGGLIADQVAAYLEQRGRLDPDGSWMAGLVADFAETRLNHPFWMARTSAAMYLAARDDPRGHEALDGWMRDRPLYLEFCAYVRGRHLNWVGVRQVLEYYLENGDAEAIVHAGAALLEYHGLFGVGGELLARHGGTILATQIETLGTMDPTSEDPRVRALAETTVLGLAMDGSDEARAALETVIPAQFGREADLVRMVRVWSGIDPFSDYALGSLQWDLLTPAAKETFFRAAAFRYAVLVTQDTSGLDEEARERHDDELADAHRLAEEGLRGGTPPTRVYCLHVLAHHDTAARRDLLDTAIRSGGVLGLFAACLAEVDDLAPIALPALASRAPDVSVMAAVAMMRLDGPGPLQPLPFDG